MALKKVIRPNMRMTELDKIARSMGVEFKPSPKTSHTHILHPSIGLVDTVRMRQVRTRDANIIYVRAVKRILRKLIELKS